MSHDMGHDLIHGAAAAILVVGGVVVLLLAAWTSRRARPVHGVDPRTAASSADRPTPPSVATIYATLGATLASAAGLIHLAAAPTHLDELGLAGWGFVVVALAQGSWALAWAIQPSRGLAIAGILGSLAIVAAWLVTRTVGMPIGAQAGVPEAIGTADAAATAFELALVAVLVVRMGRLDSLVDRTIRRAPGLPSLAAVPVLGTVAVATTIAVVAALGHGHPDGAAHGHGAVIEVHATD